MTRTAEAMGAIDPEEMARIATERNGLYRLLATIFCEELTADLVLKLKEPEFLRDLAAIGVDLDAFSSLSSNKVCLDELALEFFRHFMGPGTHVSPYESVHLGGDGGSLWGPETVAVKKFIECSGFTYEDSYLGLPDHISVELEFMAHLTGMEAEAWQLGDADTAILCLSFQKEFLDRHPRRHVT